MADEVLQELWGIKDRIAKEHSFDLDNLVEYYQHRSSLYGVSKNRPDQEFISKPEETWQKSN